MTPFPEPVADVAAQISAALDPEHPKRAAFVVPGNTVPSWVYGKAHIVERPSGTLITADAELAEMYEAGVDDITMAAILGYPEHKADVFKNCGGVMSLATAVQAKDAKGNVITDAIASPLGLTQTIIALATHVPTGGELVVVTPVEAVLRRLTLRAKEGA
jgi:hypothetical protein